MDELEQAQARIKELELQVLDLTPFKLRIQEVTPKLEGFDKLSADHDVLKKSSAEAAFQIKELTTSLSTSNSELDKAKSVFDATATELTQSKAGLDDVTARYRGDLIGRLSPHLSESEYKDRPIAELEAMSTVLKSTVSTVPTGHVGDPGQMGLSSGGGGNQTPQSSMELMAAKVRAAKERGTNNNGQRTEAAL
jgi:chromosome segregation ATPase